MYFSIDENGIKHFGIKGMKWGVRRYQNEDGSLTPAGKARYQKLQAKYERANRKYKKWKGKADFTRSGLEALDENYREYASRSRATRVLTPIAKGMGKFNEVSYDLMAAPYAKKSSRYAEEIQKLKNQTSNTNSKKSRNERIKAELNDVIKNDPTMSAEDKRALREYMATLK